MIVKTIVLKKLLEKDRYAETEFDMRAEGVSKICDCADVGNAILYEIQKNATPQYKQEMQDLAEKLGCKIIVLDLKTMPVALKDAMKELIKWTEKRI